MVNPTRIASTTAVMLTALMMELIPIAIEHMPNSVGRCSFRLFGRTCPSAEPITPPASTEIQLTITPIGIGFPSFSFPFSSISHFTVEKRLWQAKENRTAEAVRFGKVFAYFTFSQKRMSIAATSARTALPFGSSLLPDLPVTTPAPHAHWIAGIA